MTLSPEITLVLLAIVFGIMFAVSITVTDHEDTALIIPCHPHPLTDEDELEEAGDEEIGRR